VSNYLNNETSLYLTEYFNTLINWYPWSEEALQKAKTEKKPIFLSIGYSGSEKCTVMKEESFITLKVAQLLNENFISIKVDKDERTDIDKYYKQVYKLMNGQNCSSPVSVFLTEELEPFYSASYIGITPQGNVLDFETLLHTVYTKYKDDKETMVTKGREVLEYINPNNKIVEATRIQIDITKTITSHALNLYDESHGGFGNAPKFLHISTLDLLLDTYEITQNRELLSMVSSTLEIMAKGEIYDHEDGGFFRYASNRDWRLPRREKLSYDNANIASLYLRIYKITNNEFYKKIAFETLDFVIDKMSGNSVFYTNAIKHPDSSYFIDKKVTTSFSAMVIDALFLASIYDKRYRIIAIDTLDSLLEKNYKNQTLKHTNSINAFLEDYAYLGTALLTAHNSTQNSKYIILAEGILNQAIEKFYERGRWKFANSDILVYDDIYDLLYPSAMATLLLMAQRVSFIIDNDYTQIIFKSLEMHSYSLMRQPLSSPKMSKVLLKHLKKMI
jgi:uncharacterized protein YyaL (SSP411 family)